MFDRRRKVESLLARLDQLPPCLCRLLARKAHGRHGLSHSDLAQATGLSRFTVAALSLKRSWAGVSVDVVEKFSLACGVNHLNAHRQVRYLKDKKMVHLFNGHPNQKKFYAKLMQVNQPK